VAQGDKNEFLKTGEWEALINKCDSSCIKNSDSINVYIYDAWDQDKKDGVKTGRGSFNSTGNYLGYILLDYQRVLDGVSGDNQGAEYHELGHAFGLEHMCYQSSLNSDSTNFMASANAITHEECRNSSCDEELGKKIEYTCPGTGGKRDLGLNPAQMVTVLRYAKKHLDLWHSEVYKGSILGK